MTPPKTFSESLRENMRRVVLDLLEQAAGYNLSANMIRVGLAEFGHHPSTDQIETEMNWLAEQGYLSVEKRGENILVAKLTRRGADVVEGRAAVPGVAKQPIGD